MRAVAGQANALQWQAEATEVPVLMCEETARSVEHCLKVAAVEPFKSPLRGGSVVKGYKPDGQRARAARGAGGA